MENVLMEYITQCKKTEITKAWGISQKTPCSSNVAEVSCIGMIQWNYTI